MKLLFYLGHPAHFHMFKNAISILKKRGVIIDILIKRKDVLEELLDNSKFKYENVQNFERGDTRARIALALIKRDINIFKYCYKYRPDVLIGTSSEITHIGKLLNIPSIVIVEDDYNVVPLFSNLAYPFATMILSPESCNNGRWEKKSVKYNGFQKLTYLHPNYFVPDKLKIKNNVDITQRYFLLRFAKLTAHHDFGKSGISFEIASKLIELLKNYGNVYITSERALEPEFEKYRLKTSANLIHHVLYYSSLYVGDSQSMAVESAILGVPGIRFNDFVGKIGVLNELEKKYGLSIGISTKEKDKLFSTVKYLLGKKTLKDEWDRKRNNLLSEKIDVTAFMVWFFENYPKSIQIIKENPDYQYNFR